MDNSLLAVRDINHKYIVVEKERQNTEKERRRADELEAEVKRLRAMLKN